MYPEFHDKWCGSLRVNGFPWVDGKNYYLNVEYFAHGTSLSRPTKERSALIPLEEFASKAEFIDSIAHHIINL